VILWFPGELGTNHDNFTFRGDVRRSVDVCIADGEWSMELTLYWICAVLRNSAATIGQALSTAAPW
jgi:hypothetical protein